MDKTPMPGMRAATLEALRDIRAEAYRLEQEHNYRFVSVRSLAVKLGHEALLPDILRACAEGGFDYCLDHTVEMTGYHEARGEKPHPDVCYWGPDQLRSRLDCVDWRIRP